MKKYENFIVAGNKIFWNDEIIKWTKLVGFLVMLLSSFAYLGGLQAFVICLGLIGFFGAGITVVGW